MDHRPFDRDEHRQHSTPPWAVATFADRLCLEELVNDSVWLPSGTRGAALPGRKVMTLVHGMIAGSDSIDDMNVLRAGSAWAVLGHRLMAPSTLGTFLRVFSFGHVRHRSGAYCHMLWIRV